MLKGKNVGSMFQHEADAQPHRKGANQAQPLYSNAVAQKKQAPRKWQGKSNQTGKAQQVAAH